MNLTWFKANTRVARKYCAGMSDGAKYLWLMYSNNGRLHQLTGERDFRLDFAFPEPIGKIRLKLRNNKGADTFIFSELFLHNYYDLKTVAKPRNILDLGA